MTKILTSSAIALFVITLGIGIISPVMASPSADPNIVVRLVGTAIGEDRIVPDIDGDN